MKNLKKTLSMVLVVAMMLSIFVMGAGAAFTDAADVDYDEAVEVLSAVNVLAGFDDGSFKPDQTLTREQAAKIIAYALIGKTAADALTTGTAPFSDVAASRWSAGYITFCVNQGIINGYGNGKFGPADTLTGFAFGKMLLTALGYGKKGEFTGANWTIEVAKLAIPLGIYDGNTAGAANTPCTREAAALYAFNAMTGAMTVNYSDALGIYYSGTNALVAPIAAEEYKYTLGYKSYKLLAISTTEGGRDGYYWTVSGVKVSSFYSDDTVVATDRNGTDIFSLTTKGSLFFLSERDNSFKVYFNGIEIPVVTLGNGTVDVAAGGYYYENTSAYGRGIRLDDGDGKAEISYGPNGVDTSADAKHALGKGVVTQLIDSRDSTGGDSGNKVDVFNIVEKSVVKMLADPSAVVLGYVRINGTDYHTAVTKGYENLKKGDIALYVTIDGVTTYQKCESVTGKLESTGTFLGTPYYVIGGKQYYISKLPGVSVAAPTNYTADQTFYLDDSGNIVYSTEADTVTPEYYGLVLAAQQDQFNAITNTGSYAKIQMLTQEGKTVIYDVVTDAGLPAFAAVQAIANATYNNGIGGGIGEVYKYEMNASGQILATSLVAASDTALNAMTITKDSYTVGGVTGYANGSTYYFFYDKDAGEGGTPVYSVIKGYTNVQTISGTVARGSAYVNSNVIKAVLVNEKEAVGSVEVVYISSTDFTTARLDNGTVYRIYNCFKNGVADTVKTTQTLAKGAYTTTALTNGLTSLVALDVPASAEIVNADSTYFVVNTAPGVNDTYRISSTTKVFKVSMGMFGAIANVETATMIQSSTHAKVVVTFVKATETAPGSHVWDASAVFYTVTDR